MIPMRLEQLHVLYHDNLCGWNSYMYYTTRTCAGGTAIIPREAGYMGDRSVGQTCSVRGPRAVLFYY